MRGVGVRLGRGIKRLSYRSLFVNWLLSVDRVTEVLTQITVLSTSRSRLPVLVPNFLGDRSGVWSSGSTSTLSDYISVEVL